MSNPKPTEINQIIVLVKIVKLAKNRFLVKLNLRKKLALIGHISDNSAYH